MKKTLTTGLIASLLLASSLPAFAGPYGDRYDRGDRNDRGERHSYRQDRHEQRFDGRFHSNSNFRERERSRHDGHGAAWGVLGAGLALGAIALAIEAPRPPPVVLAPIVRPTAPPPGQMWYYCDSSRTYYPYVDYCPEGWRAVPAAPY